MMGISSPTGSHLATLEEEIAKLPPDALVIEHGAGLYSTPLLSRSPIKVMCAEPHVGWSEWAKWMYRDQANVVTSWKRVVPVLETASLVFIDGPASERGPLLSLCLERGVPVVIVHDTEEREWSYYGLREHLFSFRGYTVTHHAEDSHRTTRWVKRA
jgi:hypothetical protein